VAAIGSLNIHLQKVEVIDEVGARFARYDGGSRRIRCPPMPMAGLLRIHRASNISDAVPHRIVHAGINAARVHSIYRSVLNITTADGLLTVASPEAGGLPNGILADLGPDWRTIGLEPGMIVHASDASIGVPDAGLEIQLDAAPRWSPRFQLSDEATTLAMACWRRRTSATWTIARTRATAGGFGPLLREDTVYDDPFGMVGVARPIVAELIVALETGDRSAAAEVAARLIGLGPGLTPSGDDALVGIEATLHALGSPSAGFLALALANIEDRTTALAATLLRHAAAGQFAERLHTLVAALLGSEEETIVTALDRAAAWGATSGTDCLLGVLIGLDVAAGVPGKLP